MVTPATFFRPSSAARGPRHPRPGLGPAATALPTGSWAQPPARGPSAPRGRAGRRVQVSGSGQRGGTPGCGRRLAPPPRSPVGGRRALAQRQVGFPGSVAGDPRRPGPALGRADPLVGWPQPTAPRMPWAALPGGSARPALALSARSPTRWRRSAPSPRFGITRPLAGRPGWRHAAGCVSPGRAGRRPLARVGSAGSRG
jgi:hypothetical protein